MKLNFLKIFSPFMSLIFSINAFANIPVIDVSSIIQLGFILNKAKDQYMEMQKITNDIENWRNLSWSDYKNSLDSLLAAMQDMQGITSDVNRDVEEFQKLFPGYSTKITDFNKSYSDRNQALMNILQQQVHAADQAHKINQDASNRHPDTAAAIAKEELSSLRELNVLLASETKSESAYRANHLQEKAEERQNIENLIGDHHMQNDYQTKVGEGQ